jgi:hypothetical protein
MTKMRQRQIHYTDRSEYRNEDGKSGAINVCGNPELALDGERNHDNGPK